MLGILELAANAPFVTEAGRLFGFQAPSQALVKADGYREVFRFLGRFDPPCVAAAVGGRDDPAARGADMATLYEYWVFLKVLEAAVQVSGRRPVEKPEIRRDEIGESLAVGLSTGLGPNITIRFNPTFGRPSATAYSTPLRPDVIVEVDGVRHAFDAKYRLDRFDAREGDADDDSATYKRADLYKMHTYRDAISELKTAFVVYPGSEFVFFDRSGLKHIGPDTIAFPDGVGAAPLRPTDTDPCSVLRELLRVLLIPPGSSPSAD